MFRSCDRCDNPATVHLTEIRGGETLERHLCENCARSMQAPQGNKELAKLIKTFEPVSALVHESVERAGAKCPECGMTWAEFRQHGRFGCAKDYALFKKEIERLLMRIHGSTQYVGKTPPRHGAEPAPAPMDELGSARKALSEAIEAENYEEAARLRDEIARLGSSSRKRPATRRRPSGGGPER
ncbi:MAG: UvrB/UvrC motif-containing protein [Planctomycetota bacterium]|jgi:protein arginine kinase activator